jgi:hypothetical protein
MKIAGPIQRGILLLVTFFPLLLHPVSAIEATKTGKVATPVVSAIPPFRFLEHDFRLTRFRLNSILGVTVLQRAGLGVGAQFGYAPISIVPLIVGAEFRYSQFSSDAFIPGSLTSILGSARLEVLLSTASRLSVSVGLLAGLAFANGLDRVAPLSFSAFLDFAIIQDIDDLISLRWQVRPGFVDRQFAFLGDFSVAFRFY